MRDVGLYTFYQSATVLTTADGCHCLHNAGLWGPEEVDASTLAPLSRLSSLRSLRLDLCFTVSNAGGWDFLHCLQRLTSLHLEGEATP